MQRVPSPPAVTVRQDQSGGEAIAAFLRAYERAPPDAEVSIQVGSPEGRPDVKHVIVSILDARCVMTTEQAVRLADIIETAINQFPRDPQAPAFPNLVLALRHAATAGAH